GGAGEEFVLHRAVRFAAGDENDLGRAGKDVLLEGNLRLVVGRLGLLLLRVQVCDERKSDDEYAEESGHAVLLVIGNENRQGILPDGGGGCCGGGMGRGLAAFWAFVGGAAQVIATGAAMPGQESFAMGTAAQQSPDGEGGEENRDGPIRDGDEAGKAGFEV